VSSRRRILVVEDEPKVRGNIVEFLSEEGFDVVSADNGADGIALAEARTPDLVICDVMLPGVDGYGVLDAVREFDENQAFIFLSARAERADVRRGMNVGADDYLTKPFTLAELLEAVETRLRRSDEIMRRIKEAVVEESQISRRSPTPPFVPADGVVVTAPSMRAIYDQVAKVGPSNLNVLILGERGVGKEILARAVHNASPRSKGPFMALNCAALTESLLESELFGNEKGAFTGAVQARAGLLETAAGGTVFLDEVGELPAAIQATLLRVLEDRKVRRVGGRAAREMDVRFVAATNRDVDVEASRGTFRADLYDRLNAFSVTIPPLRERVEEIAPLARMFVARACAASGKRTSLPMAPECLQILERYPWPGNVRELKNAIEVAVALCEADVLRPDDLPPRLRARPRTHAAETVFDPRAELRKQTEELERQRILDALAKTANNQTLAAKLLGIARRTLLNRMNALGIDGPRKKRREDNGPDTLRSSAPPPQDEGARDRTKRPTINEEGATVEDDGAVADDRTSRPTTKN
jgi:DNA-binding NtrC family response regulator